MREKYCEEQAMVAWVLRRVGLRDHWDYDEVLQEMTYKLLKIRASLRTRTPHESCKESTYLFNSLLKMTRQHVARKYGRRRFRRGEYTLLFSEIGPRFHLATDHAFAVENEDALLKQEEHQCFQDCLRQLSRREQEFFLDYQDGETYKAIGSRRGISKERVRQIVERARIRIREKIGMHPLMKAVTA